MEILSCSKVETIFSQAFYLKKRNNMVKSVGSAFIQELIKYSISFPIYCISVEFLWHLDDSEPR
jgi:hypothetical protein